MVDKPNITAKVLLDLLQIKHGEDLSIPECKDGPTQFANHRRMDLWVMKRSWANSLSICYEIKISRSDFLNDTKWQDYLPLCNELFFVTKPGVIEKDELPEQVGLLVCSKNGVRLFTKKKAPYRDIELPENLYRYILMARTKIDSDYKIEQGSATARWKRWLAQKDEKKELGWNVSKKIRQLVTQRILEVEGRQRILEKEIKNLGELRKIALGLGFTEDQLCSPSWNFNRTAEDLLRGNRKVENLLGSLKRTGSSLDYLKKELEEYL